MIKKYLWIAIFEGYTSGESNWWRFLCDSRNEKLAEKELVKEYSTEMGLTPKETKEELRNVELILLDEIDGYKVILRKH